MPVPLFSFANAVARVSWVAEKHAKVFQLYSDRLSSLRIDLFLEAPFDFDRAFAESTTVTLDSVEFQVAGLEDLIAMKRESGRPKDLDDIEHLDALREWGEG
ncbi:MAG: hypothetical protein K8J08_17110 [Thermoanaerobaculia bacterium]|nr:hypothetical protein [Thermoanaerobaculia bacterium]